MVAHISVAFISYNYYTQIKRICQMVLWSLMRSKKMNEGVLSFIGVIIGGLIGIVGTLIANYYQNENNQTMYLLDKRREVYLSIKKFI